MIDNTPLFPNEVISRRRPPPAFSSSFSASDQSLSRLGKVILYDPLIVIGAKARGLIATLTPTSLELSLVSRESMRANSLSFHF